MNYQIGMGKSDITPFVKGAGMLGYGQPHNYIKEQATPLFSRTLFLTAGNVNIVLVNIELCFATISVKDGVIALLRERHEDWNLHHGNVMISSQHTHSGPSGYSHYPLYNFTVPGFSPKILKTIVDGIVLSIEDAFRNRKVSTLTLSSIDIPENENVAFNRSMRAYLANPEAKRLRKDEWHLALDRSMRALIVHCEGKLTGLYNLFGVHCTSISSFNHRIHYDNKGVASETFEKKHPGVIAAFAQAAAGDITPNFIFDKKLKRTRGNSTDQYESAEYNGEIQANYADKLLKEKSTDVSGEITYAHSYINMKELAAPAAHGLAFFRGTIEAPGIPAPLANALKIAAKITKARKLLFDKSNNQEFYRHHGNKIITIDHRVGELGGLALKVWKKFPRTNPDPVIKEFIREAKSGALETLPWVPEILPLQLIRLGDLVIVGVPGEITYIACERLKKMLKAELKTENILINSYANAYMGYITTQEEYQEQCYEGGHTVYGQYTLQAILRGFKELAKVLNDKSQTNIGPHPFKFPDKELILRICSL